MRPIQIIVFCLYMCSLNLYAQVSVTGTVNDNTGESLPGVSILAKDGDRTFGSTTDINGRYEIKVNQGATLEFSFIGFAKQKVKVGTKGRYCFLSVFPFLCSLSKTVAPHTLQPCFFNSLMV